MPSRPPVFDCVAKAIPTVQVRDSASIATPLGALVLSDPVELNVPALGDLAVSLYLPGTVEATAGHDTGLQTNYVSLPGDFTAAATLPVQRTITNWPFLTEVDVDAAGPAVVALGDSITDGTRSTVDTNNRRPDWLACRLQTVRDPIIGINARLGRGQSRHQRQAPAHRCAEPAGRPQHPRALRPQRADDRRGALHDPDNRD